jgi:hypothetical protein
MAPIAESPQRADVDDSFYNSAVVAVGTSQVEAKVGATRNPLRQVLTITNDNDTVEVYYGPTGVTTSGANKGNVLWPRQEAALTIGDVALFLIAASAVNVTVQEFG